MSEQPARYEVLAARGVSQVDVDRAADELLRAGERPTIEKVRARIGGGSPNTINPMLDVWWHRLSARLNAGPGAFERLPGSLAHMTEALFLHMLEEARERASLELSRERDQNQRDHQRNETRSLMLTWREREMTEQLQRQTERLHQVERMMQDLRLESRVHLQARDAAEGQVLQLKNEIRELQQRVEKRPRRAPVVRAKKAAAAHPRARKAPTKVRTRTPRRR